MLTRDAIRWSIETMLLSKHRFVISMVFLILADPVLMNSVIDSGLFGWHFLLLMNYSWSILIGNLSIFLRKIMLYLSQVCCHFFFLPADTSIKSHHFSKSSLAGTLTHYQTTNFRLFQTKKVCRWQFQIWRKWQKVIQMGRKHCGKRRNCSLRAISPFPTVFSKGLFPRGVKRRCCVGMG